MEEEKEANDDIEMKDAEKEDKAEEKKKEEPKQTEWSSDKKPVVGEEDKVELFVGNLPFNVDDDMLGEFFSTYGTVVNIKILKDMEGKPRGIAFVKFESHAECAKALESSNGAMVGGRPIRANYSGEKIASAGGAGPRNSKNDFTVFVGNIPFSATKESVSEFFKEAGEVVDVRIPLRDDGKPRGFCHVEFTTTESAKSALKFNEKEFEGRPLKVDLAGAKSSGAGKPAFGAGRGAPRGRGFGRGAPRGAPRGAASHNKGVIEEFKGSKITFNDDE